MGGRVSLSLVIHNHQPVGNFGWVIQDVYERAYEPLIEALGRHPSIRLGLHYTGPLLEWMRANKPDAIERIRALVDRGQVEIVGGGYYEPILVSLPDRDRHGQLVRMAQELETIFGARPTGAWLAERVWEPSLPNDLAAAGYRWTVLDDNHLRGAAIPEDEMWTAFTTDDRGRQLTVFGTEQGLRYRIPFKPVDDLIEYLRARRTEDGRFVGMMGDDGEKFGAWPGTYEYCWSQEHWVERLFEAIERNSHWLSTVTPSEWLAGHPPTTRVYIPNASYVEMTEWALPANETPVFTHLLEEAREHDRPEARYLRGGFWRNFAARYREINELHKQMLRVSEKVAAMPNGPAKDLATDHLYQGQSNDCYWHGLFGGIYIVHMRMATLAHLVAAEDLADRAARGAADSPAAFDGARLLDTDLDTVDEVYFADDAQTVVVDPAEGAGISSWDLRAARVALASVLRRRPEAYHQRLIDHEKTLAELAAREQESASSGDGGAKSIHDIVTTKEPNLSSRLHYDRHERRSAIVHLLPLDGEGAPATRLEQFVNATYDELGDFVEEPFEVASIGDVEVALRRRGAVRQDVGHLPLTVTKTLRFGGDRLAPTLELELALENGGDRDAAFELALEWNVNLLGGGHNPDAYYEAPSGGAGDAAGANDPIRSPHDASAEIGGGSVAFGNDYEGVRVAATASPAAPSRISWHPVETVSNSEAGFERVYQGSSLLFRWPVRLAAGQTQSFAVRFGVTERIDRAAQEAEEPVAQ